MYGKGACGLNASVVAQRKTLLIKRCHFHYLVHCPFTGSLLLSGTYAFEQRSHQPINRQCASLTDGMIVASLLTIYAHQHGFLRARFPVMNVQITVHTESTQLWLRLIIIMSMINILKKETHFVLE